MIIAPTRSFTLGKFTVHQRPRPDNPAFAQYSVYIGERFVGNSFSIPDLGCCEWLENSDGVYAKEEQTYQLPPLRLRGAVSRAWKKERQRRPGRQRKADAERELEEAIAEG